MKDIDIPEKMLAAAAFSALRQIKTLKTVQKIRNEKRSFENRAKEGKIFSSSSSSSWVR